MVNIFIEILRAVPMARKMKKEFEEQEPATKRIVSLPRYAGTAAMVRYPLRNMGRKKGIYPYVKAGTALGVVVNLADDITDSEKIDKREFFYKIIDSYSDEVESEDPAQRTCFFLSNKIGEHFRGMGKDIDKEILREIAEAEMAQDKDISYKEYEESVIKNKNGKGIVLSNELVSEDNLNGDEVDAIETLGSHLQLCDDLVDYEEDREIGDINGITLLMRDEEMEFGEARQTVSERMDEFYKEGIEKLNRKSVRPTTRDYTVSFVDISKSYFNNLGTIRKLQNLS